MSETSPESSQEETKAALEFQQAKEEGLLEQARRAQKEPEKYDAFGKEKIPPIELQGVYQTGTIAEKINHRLERGQSPLVLFSDILTLGAIDISKQEKFFQAAI